MSGKVAMVSLGCPKNQVDAEVLLSKIKKHGYELTADVSSADAVVINTCGFIESAKQESIDNILEYCELKKEGAIKAVVVTGCLAERYGKDILTEIPEADAVVGIGANDKIGEIIDRALSGERFCIADDKQKLPLSGERVVSTLPCYAYIKIAEGCSNCCTYCAIPSIRGRFRSREAEDIIKEARSLAAAGIKELIVVAQDTTRYGEDIYGAPSLDKLLNSLCEIDGIEWIRVLYCYPERITDGLIDVFAKQDKICKYIDIPIQHCSDRILKAMNRKGGKSSLTALIKKLREKVPGIVIRTTLIAGFPGETEEDFTELCEFAKETRFERLGCFAYSAEESTLAAAMDGQLDEEVKSRRAEIIMEQQMFIMDRINASLVGKTIKTLVEGYDKYAKIYFGRSEADAPEIDGKIFFYSEKPLKAGEFVDVLAQETLDYDIVGKAL